MNLLVDERSGLFHSRYGAFRLHVIRIVDAEKGELGIQRVAAADPLLRARAVGR